MNHPLNVMASMIVCVRPHHSEVNPSFLLLFLFSVISTLTIISRNQLVVSTHQDMMHHNTRHDTRGNTSIILPGPNCYTKGAFEIVAAVVV